MLEDDLNNLKKINKNLLLINNQYTFQNAIKQIDEFKKNNLNINIVSLGIGDVTLPIIKPIVKAMHKAVDDLGDIKTFKGYGAYYGYNFLKEKILENEYKDLNFTKEEIYISDGSKTDVSNILELFDINSNIYIPSIIYPVYECGINCLNRKFKIVKVDKSNNFFPIIPKKKYDIIYLCSPNNPLGIAYSKEELAKWVDYALKNNSVILYDNVYYPFINSKGKPKSIYEIKNAKKVSIEFRSFSKKISFTGVRCSYYIIPKELHPNINLIWQKRTINRFNGADYIAQRGAEASYLPEAKKLISNNITYYLNNAKLLREAYTKLGFEVNGGIDSPYLWIKIKDNIKSWDYFKLMLEKVNIIIIPGIIFGKDGDNYFRVSSLSNRNDIKEAIRRLKVFYE